MEFELIDGYFLDGDPPKGEVVRRLLERPSPVKAAHAFYEGMRMLRDRTPELSLLALRLVLAGKPADDAAVVRLRAIVVRVRAGDDAARVAYREELR